MNHTYTNINNIQLLKCEKLFIITTENIVPTEFRIKQPIIILVGGVERKPVIKGPYRKKERTLKSGKRRNLDSTWRTTFLGKSYD